MGWEKVACWSTKAAISLKRVQIEEKLLWRAYRKSPTLFRMVPSPIPYGLLFPRLGFATHPKTAIAIISGKGKATNFKFGNYIQSVHANKSRLKIWEKRERGRIQGVPNFFEYPLLSQECVKLRTSNLAGIFTGSIRTKAPEKFGRKGSIAAWADPGTSQIWGVQPVISGTRKAITNFKFCTHIDRIDRNKSPLKISVRVTVGVVRDSRNFLWHPHIANISCIYIHISCIARSSLR